MTRSRRAAWLLVSVVVSASIWIATLRVGLAQIAERRVAIGARLTGEAEDPLRHDVALHLVGPAGDADGRGEQEPGLPLGARRSAVVEQLALRAEHLERRVAQAA